MQENTNMKLKDSDRDLRIAMKYDPGINPDRSTDARKSLTLPLPRVKHLKTSASVADGQYTRETSTFIESKLITYSYLPNQIFRRYNKDNSEIPILERISGEWFTVDGVILKDSEIQSMRAFPGSFGLDIDAIVKRKKRRSVTSTKTVNDRGLCTYKCDNPTYDQVEKNLFDRDIRRHEAVSKRILFSNVKIVNVKRKK
jgi:hypothetical protein